MIHQYDGDSKEYKDFQTAQKTTDAINLAKVEYYLNFHGYPEKEMGEIATTAPWVVIHHAADFKTRERNFKIIYKAYLKEAIDIDALSMYLGRMYKMKFGERHRMKNPYKPEDEINLLTEKLELK
ncbi:hypothetical protein [Marivirga sp.]|uniref:hypothetical protein n=1 Tax=Marivirga sp. TaxID=2018662 RepID=UPI002D7E8E80|nr:hypothetical protein [Marivirga sp.]HET8858382.1 hypothetical protein [Marivirga sp.]